MAFQLKTDAGTRSCRFRIAGHYKKGTRPKAGRSDWHTFPHFPANAVLSAVLLIVPDLCLCRSIVWNARIRFRYGVNHRCTVEGNSFTDCKKEIRKIRKNIFVVVQSNSWLRFNKLWSNTWIIIKCSRDSSVQVRPLVWWCN